MRFNAQQRGPHFYVNAVIECPQIQRPSVITFLLDTGCSVTTLLPFDVMRLNIPWRSLAQDRPVGTGRGMAVPRILPNVTIRIPGNAGLFNHERVWIGNIFGRIHTMDPTFQCDPYSLLGMDFLLSFKKWKIHNTYATLET